MRTAYEIRAEQDASAKQIAERQIVGFAAKVEACVTEASREGLHRVSVLVPEALVTSINTVGLGYERLGYAIKVEREMGFLGLGLYRRPTTWLVLSW